MEAALRACDLVQDVYVRVTGNIVDSSTFAVDELVFLEDTPAAQVTKQALLLCFGSRSRSPFVLRFGNRADSRHLSTDPLEDTPDSPCLSSPAP